MTFTTSAGNDEFQPFICHDLKFLYIQFHIKSYIIYRNNFCCISFCPSFRLLFDNSTVKSIPEIFGISPDTNFRSFNSLMPTMIYSNHCHCPSSLHQNLYASQFIPYHHQRISEQIFSLPPLRIFSIWIIHG